jgi:hypothetical protein
MNLLGDCPDFRVNENGTVPLAPFWRKTAMEEPNHAGEPAQQSQQPEAKQHGAECRCPECLCKNMSACECFRQYTRQNPEIVALWCFGLGFVLGWKLRPHR